MARKRFTAERFVDYQNCLVASKNEKGITLTQGPASATYLRMIGRVNFLLTQGRRSLQFHF